MKVYIQCNEQRIPYNETAFAAYRGFYEMGFETVFFHSRDAFAEAEQGDVVVGGLGTTQYRLNQLGCSYPELDYPESLQTYLGRRVWMSRMDTVNETPELWPVFVKPYIDKRFIGRVIREPKDLIGCGSCYENYEVICSEVVDFTAEWRVFVRYGQILDVRRYRGDWREQYDPHVIACAVSDYRDAPAGYAMDFGVTKDGRTLLVEVNDGFSLGAYGLQNIQYAKLLSARWAELTGTEDACRF